MTVVILSSHARERLAERNIQESLVRRCLVRPDKILSTKDEEKKSATKLDGTVLVVGFKEIDTDIFLIITAFISSQVNR